MDIVTKRLLLREFVDGDLAAFVAYQADPRYAEFWPEEVPLGYGRRLVGMFRNWAAETPRRNYQLVVTDLRSPQECIGTCGLRGNGFDAGTAEFGIELAPEWWGHGYAAEAGRATLAFGFCDLELQELRGLSVTENSRVTQMALSLGFTQLGRRPGPAWMDTRGWSQTEWQLTREQWESRVCLTRR